VGKVLVQQDILAVVGLSVLETEVRRKVVGRVVLVENQSGSAVVPRTGCCQMLPGKNLQAGYLLEMMVEAVPQGLRMERRWVEER